jgi:hypothetical protein
MFSEFESENMMGRDHLKDLVVYRKITLKWVGWVWSDVRLTN